MTTRDSGEDAIADVEPAWRRYLRFWKRDPEADVRDELRFHFESAVVEFRAAGMSDALAHDEARRRFGDVRQITHALYTLSNERERTMRRAEWFDALGQDVRIALHRLRSSPGFAMTVVLTLAIGIGANSAIFSVVNAVMLRALPYQRSASLVNLREGMSGSGPGGMFVTYGNYGTWVEQSHSFEALGGYEGAGSLTLTGAGEPQQVRMTRATVAYWKALYIRPMLGRSFDAGDDAPGSAKVVVLSYGLWRSAFASDSTIVGKSITLNGESYIVRGVASPQYALTPQAADGWIPLPLTAAMLAEHSDHEMSVVGLVKNGITVESAVAELGGIQRKLRAQYPNGSFDGTIVAKPYIDYLVGPSAALLKVIFGAAGIVLLIACVNIANLLLVRTIGRQKELAVRGALGAGRGRIISQLLVESLVLAGGGAVAGLGVAAAGTRFLILNGPQSLPRLHEASLDLSVVLFTIAVALGAGIGFGLAPALRASRLDLQSVLREAGRTAATSFRSRVRSVLVVAQVSLALVLLVSAGLLVRSAIRLQQVPPGFDPSNVLVGGLGLPGSRYPTDAAVNAKFEEILQAVAAIPGVESAALVSRVPIGNLGADCALAPVEWANDKSKRVGADNRTATPGYFHTFGIPIVAGRTFDAGDRANAPPVAIINKRLAHELFGNDNAIGRRVVGCGSSDTPTQIVGVSGDIHADGLAQDVSDQVYLPSAQFPGRGMTLLVRGHVPVLTLLPSVRRAVTGADALLPLSRPTTMEAVISQTLATSRFQSALLAMLGVCGLLLAVIGIYGVVAFLVAQRTVEIGIRMALGASKGEVFAMVVREGVLLAGFGIAAGVVIAFASGRAIEGLLFGIGAHDPLTFTVAAVLLTVVAGAASVVPARRAMRVDPLVAMRAG